MEIVKDKDLNIEVIVETLQKGGMIIFPSETTYGIGVDATSTEAVRKLDEYKERPVGKPYSIAVADQEMAEEYVTLNETAENLYKNFLPGPITVVSRIKKQKLAPGVAAENGTVGIRISSYPLVTEIVKALGKPMTATSANASYKRRPYKIEDVLDNISKKQKRLIDLVIDAGELAHNDPSTVVDTTMDDPVVLRQGKIRLSGKGYKFSKSEEETRSLGQEMWRKYEKYAGKRGIIFAVEGPMGAGKTQFTKGVAKAMGIAEEIVSPTFNLEIKYTAGNNLELSHVDAWRMQTGDEMEQLGLKGLINDHAIMIIEWADRVAEVIRKYDEEAVVVWIKIEYGEEINERKISWGVI